MEEGNSFDPIAPRIDVRMCNMHSSHEACSGWALADVPSVRRLN